MVALRVILGDQLSASISALDGADKDHDIILMAEVMGECTYVRHHKKKIAFLFSAMRHFADDLKAQGYTVRYITLDDPENAGSLNAEVLRAVNDLKPDRIIATFPGEYRVHEDMKRWGDDAGIPIDIRHDNRFLCAPEEFQSWAAGRKNLRMEFFYREMRQKYNILMDGKKPEGGEWNYDSKNRKSPPEGGLLIPSPCIFTPDSMTQDVMSLVAEKFHDHFGDLEPFYFAVTREQALRVLDVFLKERLPFFGDYQDAMIQGQPWMYHSHLSFYLNCGLLNPLEVVRAAEKTYRDGKAPLNATEGFIRQILGWREYIRGIYWLKMPDYADENFLKATRNLPWLYWGGETSMNCMRQCVDETKAHAYAHHIQRLMVLGNFALLAGIDPKQVNEWYLVVYADAYEWVELPNVSGMILFADGGYLASKPYAASGAYINKMSDYCKNCTYDVKLKEGPKACPFNYLYWNFMIENEERLRGNPRLGFSYKTLDAMSNEKRSTVQSDAQKFFTQIGI
jgi:deoxyribodipyrimidine photolyase-related protein